MSFEALYLPFSQLCFREVKDNYAGADSKLDQQDGMPDLLKAVLQANPDVFSGKGKF